MKLSTIGLMIGVTLIGSNCDRIYPTFEPEPSGAVSGYRCPPLVDYENGERDRAAAQVEPGSAADKLISDYFLVREMCR